MNKLNAGFEMQYLHSIKETIHNLLIYFKQEKSITTVENRSRYHLKNMFIFSLKFLSSFLSYIYSIHLPLHHSFETIVIRSTGPPQ